MKIIIEGPDHEKVLPLFTFEEERQNGQFVKLTKIYYYQQFNCRAAELTARGTELECHVSPTYVAHMIHNQIKNHELDAKVKFEGR